MSNRLTPRQREIVLLVHDGNIIRGHKRPDDSFCYRLLTADYRPLRNLSAALVGRVINYGYLMKTMEGLKLCSDVHISKKRRIYMRAKADDS